ncbi:MAG: hypothetical protein HYY40_04285 [Bacteroidetes bacterium]|nr:hypothetical protein [Bacteroidota bacterium]
MDGTFTGEYDRHIAAIADNATGQNLVYMTRYIPPVTPADPGTTQIVAFEFSSSTAGTPVPQVVAEVAGYDTGGEGELQISPDGKRLAYYNRKLNIGGFSHKQVEVNIMTLTADRKSIVPGQTIVTTDNGAGTYGKSSVDFSAEQDLTYYNQRGIFEQSMTGSEKNIWQYNTSTQSFTLANTTQYGEVRKGADGYNYVPGQENDNNLTTIDNSTLAIGSNAAVADAGTGYGLSGNLPAQALQIIDAYGSQDIFSRNAGKKSYEIKTHLGDAVVILSDRLGAEDLGGGIIGNYAVVSSYNSYYPFGMQMPGRNFNSSDYRFGFNGYEKDNEWRNIQGADYDFDGYGYDALTGRRKGPDPLAGKYPEISPYAAFGNNPVLFVDADGKVFVVYTKIQDKKGNETEVKVTFDGDVITMINNKTGETMEYNEESQFVNDMITSYTYIVENNADVDNAMQQVASSDIEVEVTESSRKTAGGYEEGEIDYNFKYGVEIRRDKKKIGKQSPALGFWSEVYHAYLDLFDKAKQKQLEEESRKQGPDLNVAEEEYVHVKKEGQVIDKLRKASKSNREMRRKSYKEGEGVFKAKGATSTKEEIK